SRRLNAGFENDPGQVTRVFAATDGIDRGGIAGPQHHFMAGPQHGQCQCSPPGAAAQHGYAVPFLLAHALAPRLPAPMTGTETSSSGQRERGTKAKASSPPSPARIRSMPAQAIIAALSVQSLGGGATTRKPASRHNVSSVALSERLAATPPAITRAGSRCAGYSALKRASARATRSASASATAAWNEAQMSATSCSVRGAIELASWRTAV